VTTAWIDLRDCDRSKVADIVAAAAENRIEAVVTNSEIDQLVGTRPPGIQWVAFEDAGEGFGAMNGADVHVHASHGRANGLLVSALKLSGKDGILVDVDGKERLDEACAAVERPNARDPHVEGSFGGEGGSGAVSPDLSSSTLTPLVAKSQRFT